MRPQSRTAGRPALNDIDTVLTDMLMGALCTLFAWRIGAMRASERGAKRAWATLFASLAAASFAGAIIHATFRDETAQGYRPAWTAGLLIFTLTILGGWAIIAHLVPAKRWRMVARMFGAAQALAMAAWLLRTPLYGVVICNYMLPSIVLLALGTLSYIVRRQPFGLCLVAGIATTFAAAIAQQSGTTLPSLGLGHNAIYHLVQSAALALLFVAGRGHIRSLSPSLSIAG